MINIEGKNYYFNLQKISDFVNYSNQHPIKESEIVDLYDKDEEDKNSAFDISSKTVREATTFGNSQIDNIRYDLVKTIISQVISFGYNENDRIDNLPFGFELSFNTLIKEGFLVEIK